MSTHPRKHPPHSVNRHSTTLINWLEEHCVETGSPVNIQVRFFRLTIDIFAEIAFGCELKSTTMDAQHPFADAFDEIQRECESRFFNPVWGICRAFQLTASERKIRSATKIIDQFASDIIQSKRRLASDKGSLGPDLLSLFLDMTSSSSADRMTDKELRDVSVRVQLWTGGW